jgi:hypothetical protein
MQDDTFLAFLDGHRERIERMRKIEAALACTDGQIERSRVAIAYSRMLLSLQVVTLGDIEGRPPPSQSNG